MNCAAADARADLVLIVRCYAVDRPDNLDRCMAYAAAGADVVYPGGGLRTAEDFSRIAEMVKKPLMTTLNANMPVSMSAGDPASRRSCASTVALTRNGRCASTAVAHSNSRFLHSGHW